MSPLRPTLTVLSLTAPGQRTAGAGVRMALRIAFESGDPYAAPLVAAVRTYVEEALRFGIQEVDVMRALRLHVHQVGCDVPEPELADVLREVERLAAAAVARRAEPARHD